MRRLPARGLLVDLGLIALAVAGFFVFGDSLGFLTRILIMMVFAVSLDLVLGYAGVATLGHAALFGVGAYAAGLYAVHVTGEPLSGLLAGAAAGAVIAFVSGLLLMRAAGLTLLMLSIAVAEVLQEIANQARSVTGGADGLGGIWMEPILGLFEFDLYGRTSYLYALTVLVVVFALAKLVAASPFGLAARGIHENPARMRAIGTPVYRRLVGIYVIAGAFAGIAGALSAQTTELVSPSAFAFSLSAEALIMLIIGGTGRLYGALLGVLVFMTVHHVAASIDPFNWLFIIGALVLAVVFFFPGGLLTVVATMRRWRR